MLPLILCILSEFDRIHAICLLEDICFIKLDYAQTSVNFLSYVNGLKTMEHWNLLRRRSQLRMRLSNESTGRTGHKSRILSVQNLK